MAWSNGKSAIFGLKTADLNGGFRLDVVSTRSPSGQMSDNFQFARHPSTI
jgi:hypothetical protein